jgi:hypothetical protein
MAQIRGVSGTTRLAPLAELLKIEKILQLASNALHRDQIFARPRRVAELKSCAAARPSRRRGRLLPAELCRYGRERDNQPDPAVDDAPRRGAPRAGSPSPGPAAPTHANLRAGA